MTNIFIGYCAGVMVSTLTILVVVYKFEMKDKTK